MLRSIVALSLVLISGSLALAQSSKNSGPLKVGDKAPDFKVETFGGEMITLSDRFGDDGKVSVLLFSRANW